MPEGIVATVDDGFATLDFVDKSLRGPALQALLEIGGPATIETLTRVGPRRQYRVPEGNAREAGLLDGEGEPRARGLASIEDQPEGTLEDGVRGAFTPGSAGIDSGAAAALKAADPNVNAGTDDADWHTPSAEYTSANAYVGETTAAEERAMAPSPKQYPDAVGGGYGGRNAGETPTHRDVIDRVKEYAQDNPKGSPRGEAQRTHGPVQHLNAGLGDQDSALADDPGSRPDVGGMVIAENYSTPEATRGGGVSDQERIQTEASAGTAEGNGGAVEIPADAYPEGEPNDDWRRPELDSYALDKKGLDTTGLPNKKAVLEAINNPSEKS